MRRGRLRDDASSATSRAEFFGLRRLQAAERREDAERAVTSASVAFEPGVQGVQGGRAFGVAGEDVAVGPLALRVRPTVCHQFRHGRREQDEVERRATGLLVELDALGPNREVVRHVVAIARNHVPRQPDLTRPIRVGVKGERREDRARCPPPDRRQLQPLHRHKRQGEPVPRSDAGR